MLWFAAQKRYTPNPHLDPEPPEGGGSDLSDPSALVSVVFFSLLRKGTPDRDRSEAKLAEAFDYVGGAWLACCRLPGQIA